MLDVRKTTEPCSCFRALEDRQSDLMKKRMLYNFHKIFVLFIESPFLKWDHSLVRTQNFPKVYNFLPADTRTYVYLPRGKKC